MGLTPSQIGNRAGGVRSYFARHATAANRLLVVLIAAGLTAFPKMRAQFFPDVIIESVSVSVVWDGAGAEDVDRAIVQLIEPALLGVRGRKFVCDLVGRAGHDPLKFRTRLGYGAGDG